MRHQGIQLAAGILAKAVNRIVIGKNSIGKLRKQELLDRPLLQIRIEEPAINSPQPANRANRQVAKDVFADQLRDPSTAINKTSGDGDPVAVVVLQVAARTVNWIDQTRRAAGAVVAR